MAKQRRSVEKERYWRRIVGEQAVSGQSIRAFCRERQLSEPSFYVWRRELKRRDAAHGGRLSAATQADDKRTDFVAVDVVEAAAAERHLEIIVGGVVIRVREDACLDALGRVMAAARRLRGETAGPSQAGVSPC